MGWLEDLLAQTGEGDTGDYTSPLSDLLPGEEPPPDDRLTGTRGMAQSVFDNLSSIVSHPLDTIGNIVNGIVDQTAQNLKDVQDEPIRGVPLLLELLGGAAGAIGNPLVGPAAGAALGRFVGEYAEHKVRGTPLFTNQNLIEMFSAPLFNLPFSLLTGALKGGVGKAAIEEALAQEAKVGERKGLETIIEPTVPKRTQLTDDLIKEGYNNAALRRQYEHVTKQQEILDDLHQELVQRTYGEPAPGLEAEPMLPGMGPRPSRAKFPSAIDMTPDREKLLTRAYQFYADAPDAPDAMAFLMHATDKELNTAIEANQSIANSIEEGIRTSIARNKVPDRIFDDIDNAKAWAQTAPGLAPDTPLAAEMQRIGLVPGIRPQQRVLREAGDPNLNYIADATLLTQEGPKPAQRYFDSVVDRIGEQYDLTQPARYRELYPKLLQIGRDPKIMAQAKAGTLPKGILEDPLAMKAIKVVQEIQDEVGDPLMAIMLHVNPDPKVLAQMNPNYVASASTGHRLVQGIAEDADFYAKQLASLTPEQLASPLGDELKSTVSALNRKLAVANSQAGEAEKILRLGDEHFEKYGAIPDAAFFGAFKESKNQMVFGPNIIANWKDYIERSLKKAYNDIAIPAAKEALTGVTAPDAQRYAAKAIMDQTGHRQYTSILRIADWAKNIPGIGKFMTPNAVMKTIDGINQFLYTFDVAVNPRFIPINLTQSLMTRAVTGEGAFAHGLGQAIGNWRPAFERAVAEGVIEPDALKLFTDGAVSGTGKRILRALGQPAAASEAFNRVVAFESGLASAAERGYKGQALIDKAKAVVSQTQFGYGRAERAMINANPAAGLAFRFRGYTSQFASTLNFLRKENPKAAAEMLTTMLALAGTTGIPGYDFVRSQLADKAKVYWPELEPIAQITGADYGRSADPWFTWPKQPTDWLGPVYGPILQGVGAAVQQDPTALAYASQRLMGPLASRSLAAAGELYRGGVTRTPVSRQILAHRDLGTILKSAAGFAPAPRQERGQVEKELEMALAAGDLQARQRLLREYRLGGGRATNLLIGQARGQLKQAREKSWWGALLGE